MENEKVSSAVGVVLSVLSALLVIGVQSFAAPCGVHEDGSVSSCFWAARAVLGVGAVLLILSVIRIFERDGGVRRGLSLAATNLGVLVLLLPGTLIDLCMMGTMRCNAIMRPFVMCVGAAVAVVAGADVIMGLLRLRRAARD